MLRPKIIHVIGALAAGGAERFVVDLLCDLRQRGIEVELIVLSPRCDRAGEAMRCLLDRHEIPVAIGPTLRLGIRTVLWYLRQLWQRRPTLVHLHTSNTELAHFLATQMWRVHHHIFRTIHSTATPGSWLECLALRQNKADVSIGCSQAAAREHRSYVSGDIVCVQNGISFSWPIRTQNIADEYKHLLGLERGFLHYLAIGSMAGECSEKAPKAHDVLVKSWKLSQLGKKNCRLHLIGDGPLRSELQSLAINDPSIAFHGVRADISDWLLAVDCFVMPSRWEGLPIAGIEAVGTGLPCIFTDIPQLRELEPPVASWVSVNDIDALSNSLIQFAMEHRLPSYEDTSAIRSRFNISDVATKYAQIYERRCSFFVPPLVVQKDLKRREGL